MKIILDGNKISSVNELHDVLKRQTEYEYYGRNLDAFYDILSEQTDFDVEIQNIKALKEHLGEYYFKLMKVLKDVE